MPTYDYFCPVCNITQELSHKMNETPTIVCDRCCGKMEKLITTANIPQFKGNWFKTKGSY